MRPSKLDCVPVTVAALVLLAATGCSETSEGPAGLLGSVVLDDVLFLTLEEEQTVVMDALFEGRVTLDDAGCLRLDGPDAHTVVWPKDFELTVEDGTLAVRDDEGRPVGRIGGSFRLGGGEVPVLHEGIPLGPEAVEEAETRCPGRFWIVGEAL